MDIDKIEDLLVNKGLYDMCQIDVNDLDILSKRLIDNQFNNSTIDCFCVNCGDNKTFKLNTNTQYSGNVGIPNLPYKRKDNKSKPSDEDRLNGFLNKIYTQTYRCARDNNHTIMFDLITESDYIIKIGQFPSVADLNKGDTKKYKNILADQYTEYTTSLGLYSHGVGIGSFVYLRRIIEKLVYSKYEKYSDKLNLSDEDFEKKDFKGKIEVLKDYLPNNLVKNKNIYSIVSEGIHSLSEKECLEMYDGVKLGIQLILDEEIAEKERNKKEKELEKFVAEKTGELKAKK